MLSLRLVVSVLLLVTCLTPPFATTSEITGSVYHLPDPTLSRITDTTVIIEVFAVLEQSGQLVRDASGALVNGNLIASGKSDRASGEYKVSNIPGGSRVVNIQYNRSGEGVTRRLEGIVVSNAAPTVLDVTVPEQLFAPCFPYLFPPCHSDSPATLLLQVPSDATITIDGNPTNSTGSQRKYVSPPIMHGREYFYTLKASIVIDGRMREIVRRVQVRPGETTNVRFEDLGAGLPLKSDRLSVTDTSEARK